MPFDGYLEIGGVEIINVERTQAYVRHMAPHIVLPQAERYEGLRVALGDAPYRSPALDGAEWVTTDVHEFGGFVGEYQLHADTATHRFYGLYPLEIQGIGDSTYSAAMTEGVLDGGRTGVGRNASRSMRVHGLLIGADPLAAQLGREWLKNVLDAEDCSMHDSFCGTSDLRYFLDFPEVCGVWIKGHAGDSQEFGEVNPGNSPLVALYKRNPAEGEENNPFGYTLIHDAQWRGMRADGQIMEWGVTDPTTGKVIEHHGPIVLQRSNYASNPSFTADAVGWTAATSTLSRVATGGSDGGAFGRLTENSPPAVRYNWAPDPEFKNPAGTPQASGWRNTNSTASIILVTPSINAALFTKGAAATQAAEVSLLGPFTPALSSLSFNVGANSAPITVEVVDNLGAVIYSQVLAASGTSRSVSFQAVSGPNYVVRFTTASPTLQVWYAKVEEGTSPGLFFSGSSTSTPPTTQFSYIGEPFISASRSRVGALTSHSLTTLAPDTRYDALTASMYLRSAKGADLTLQIIANDGGAVLGTRTISVPFGWTRFFVSAPLGRNTRLVISGTGSYDIDQVLIESGTLTVDDYFDGSTPPEAGHVTRWLAGPNTSTSRTRALNPTPYEDGTYRANDGGPFPSNEVFVVSMDYEGPELETFITMVRGAIPDPELTIGSAAAVGHETQIESVERRYHSVSTLTGLKVLRELELDQGAYAIEVEFFLGAEVPWAYGPTYQITDNWNSLENYLYSDTRDVVVNSIPDPSVEGRIAGTTVDLINRVQNPSLETATTGYNYLATAGGTGTLTNPVATTTFGTHVLQCAWASPTTALGAGVLYDVAVSAGSTYSFGVGLMRPSIGQTMQLQVEWRTAAATISTVSATAVVLAANATGSTKLENQVAPATATIARIRIVGTSAFWTAGSTLQIDGLICTQTGFLPTYFDGSTVDPTGEYVYSWGGTAHASGTNRAVVMGNTATADMAGGIADCYLSPVNPKSGTYAVKAEWFLTSTLAGGGIVNPGGRAAVTPGDIITASAWASASRARSLAISVAWYTSGGILISTTTASPVAVAAATWTRLVFAPPGGPTLIVPDTAAFAEIRVVAPTALGVGQWVAGDWLKVDAVQVTEGMSVVDYFDGSSASTGYVYAWTGPVNNSPSTRTYAPAAPPSLFDPTLPALPSPPDAPDVSDIAFADQKDWRRYLVPIPARTVASWASTVPTITLSSKTKEIRQVRIRFMPNPFGLDADRVDPLYYCGEMIVSYIPPATELIIDGITEGGYATIAGQESIPADSVLYGTGGFPVSWPEMTCGTDYVMTIDVLPTLSVADLNIDLSVSLRE